MDAHYSYCEELVKRHDPDRYVVTLLFPDDARRRLMPLFAFNHEIASIAESVSEPMVGLIKLSWWKEAIDQLYEEGKVRQHPVLLALQDALGSTPLSKGWHHPIIAARETDVNKQSLQTLESFYQYCMDSSGILLGVAAAMMGGVDHECHDIISKIGRAWAVCGNLRSIKHAAAHGRCILPADILKKHGATTEDVLAGKNSEGVFAAVHEIAQLELTELGEINARKYPEDIQLFRLFEVSVKWWLRRIIKHSGRIFINSPKSGKFLSLSTLWLASRRVKRVA